MKVNATTIGYADDLVLIVTAHICYQLGQKRIKLMTHLQYLGITLGERLRFGEHVKRVAQKAGEITPNKERSGSEHRIVDLCALLHFMELQCGVQCYRKCLLLLRVTSTYRTVSSVVL